MLSTEVGEEWVLQDPANGWSRNAQSDHPVSFHFQSNQTFCASFFLSVFSFHAATEKGTPQKISPQD